MGSLFPHQNIAVISATLVKSTFSGFYMKILDFNSIEHMRYVKVEIFSDYN